MDALNNLMYGFGIALEPINIAYVFAGVFAGTIIGMLPGLGPISALALMIPITFAMEPSSGLILMAGVYYGAIFGGSTSSILLNAPGVAARWQPPLTATRWPSRAWRVRHWPLRRMPPLSAVRYR
tara:strand:- start:494 stop:868 length:375 start_codon:yes stop_codon:yes gene_type:complete